MNLRLPMRVLRPASRVCPGLLFVATVATARRVALTFDDGPHEECTPRLLDALGAAGVRATFFLQGCNAVRHPALVRRASREGHQIAAHGAEHVSALGQSAAQILRNAVDGHEALVDIIGAPLARDYRPPYGDMTLGGLRALRRNGYRLAYWSYDSNDSFLSGSAQLVSRIRNHAPLPGSILLFHEDYPHTVEALPAVIAALAAMKLSMATVAELCPR